MTEPTYRCCPHCEPACRYRDDHTIACAQGCLPYTNQEEDTMSDDMPTADEALTDILESERARFEEAYGRVTEELVAAVNTVEALEHFIVDSVSHLGAMIVESQNFGDDEVVDALRAYMTRYLMQLPTPGHIQDRARMDTLHSEYHTTDAYLDILRKHLIEKGEDPDAIIQAKADEANEFIKTLLQGGLVEGFQVEFDDPEQG